MTATPNELYKTLRVKEIREEVKDFKTIVFEEGHGISYKAGQYLTLVHFEGGEELRRSYSITSAPALSELLSIGVKRVENGAFSRILIDRAKPGDELLTTGAGGFFVLPDDVHRYQQIFFFAAGSGITPAYSLLKTILYTQPHLSVVLVYSNASVEKTIFLKSLQILSGEFAERFHLELLFSNAVDLSKARLHRSLILSLLERYTATEKDKTLFYTCGPENYMRLCVYTLEEAGMKPAHIKRENFYLTTTTKRDAAPPDKNDHTVVIKTRNKLYTVLVRYPDSILKAAKGEGIVLPYSCESGQCGNCAARCLRGNVWHSYNEVLTEEELRKGLVLTCVGHPVGGDIEIEI
ncbi:ferredoxin--NADP reductase [Flavisolibacter ginsenosidimutans]|uniref:Ferredoxin--NADP reductase n=1 Tax=Flavisolibacter ginsenosidimutans TaxID=661481 RepID=A0A5B8UMV1_9BACT|nr:ferredoxin--NADP reductase [Flavisolibacter ginsenosidimutans]QEC57908.1 ferredoxin--NADP reductase [Flavisolibacter ginsenosidimutans]